MIGEIPMHRSLALLAAALFTTASAQAGNRSFAVDGFDRILLAGSTDVDVRVGPRTAVTATGDAADLDRLEIRVQDGTLFIGTKPGRWTWRSRGGIRVAVSSPALVAATINGSGDMTVDRLSGERFDGRVSGSGALQLADVAVQTMSLSIAGSGGVRAAGRCGAADIRLSGSGDVAADRLASETLSVSVSGSGDVAAGARQTADLSVSGSGSIRTTGGARCTTRKAGSGTIRCG
jgi:hypothetical protein